MNSRTNGRRLFQAKWNGRRVVIQRAVSGKVIQNHHAHLVCILMSNGLTCLHLTLAYPTKYSAQNQQVTSNYHLYLCHTRPKRTSVSFLNYHPKVSTWQRPSFTKCTHPCIVYSSLEPCRGYGNLFIVNFSKSHQQCKLLFGEK